VFIKAQTIIKCDILSSLMWWSAGRYVRQWRQFTWSRWDCWETVLVDLAVFFNLGHFNKLLYITLLRVSGGWLKLPSQVTSVLSELRARPLWKDQFLRYDKHCCRSISLRSVGLLDGAMNSMSWGISSAYCYCMAHITLRSNMGNRRNVYWK